MTVLEAMRIVDDIRDILKRTERASHFNRTDSISEMQAVEMIKALFEWGR